MSLPSADMPPSDDEIRRRQRSRSRVMGFILAALAVLFFFITIAKMA